MTCFSSTTQILLKGTHKRQPSNSSLPGPQRKNFILSVSTVSPIRTFVAPIPSKDNASQRRKASKT
jgi:hypothetical protein